MNAAEPGLSNFSPPAVVMEGMKTTRGRSGGKFGKWMVYAPVALELIGMVRRNQKAKRGKYTKLRRRDRALDFLLGQAEKGLGKRTGSKRRWF